MNCVVILLHLVWQFRYYGDDASLSLPSGNEWRLQRNITDATEEFNHTSAFRQLITSAWCYTWFTTCNVNKSASKLKDSCQSQWIDRSIINLFIFFRHIFGSYSPPSTPSCWCHCCYTPERFWCSRHLIIKEHRWAYDINLGIIQISWLISRKSIWVWNWLFQYFFTPTFGIARQHVPERVNARRVFAYNAVSNRSRMITQLHIRLASVERTAFAWKSDCIVCVWRKQDSSTGYDFNQRQLFISIICC
jgi:hypothetical protein